MNEHYVYYFDNHGHILGTELSTTGTKFSIGSYSNGQWHETASKDISGEPSKVAIGDDEQHSGYYFDGPHMTVDVFKFMADNTYVEWSLCCRAEVNGSGYGRLTTRNKSESCATFILSEGEKFFHSHPRNDGTSPSEEDIEALEDLREEGYSEFYIYNPRNQHTVSYDENGSY